MFKAFVTLFSQGDALFCVLFALSIALFVLKVFVSKFGIAGFCGILMTLGAISARCVDANNETDMLFYIFWCVFIVFAVSFLTKLVLTMILNHKKAKLMTMVKGNQVPLTEEGNPDYSFLVGETGEVVSDLKPFGKVEICGRVYDATTTKEYVFSGSKVVVSKVIAQKIIVKKIGGDEE